jgi:hypothetical protein
VPPNATAVLKIADQENMPVSEVKGRIQKLPNDSGYRFTNYTQAVISFRGCCCITCIRAVQYEELFLFNDI